MKRSPAQTYQNIAKNRIDSEFLRNKLKLKSLEAREFINSSFPEVVKFFNQKGIDLARIRKHSAKVIGAGAITGALLFTPPVGLNGIPSKTEIIESLKNLGNEIGAIPQKTLIGSLKKILPKSLRALTQEEEKILEQLFEEIIGVKAKANLEGEHLNTTYGLIGAEQHLKRYPGDIAGNHVPFLKEGMAPGLGAWGYFASSKETLTKSLEETERWYAVVQTLYLPDWDTRFKYLRDWYKYRKVLIVNTENGNAVVAAIADSGPAAWTGKSFGGSPEVMEYLGGPRYKKGPVIVFFVDDPENKVPLGPVEYNKLPIPESSLIKI